jgi:HlyD family secretion protein
MNSRLNPLLSTSLVLASLTVFDLVQTPAAEPAFQTAKVTRGDLRVVIRATGTIEPAETMDVGAQVSGRIVSFGEDPNSKGKSIDYGSKIARDQLLATIDDAVYRARLDEAQASLQIAEAKLELAKVKIQTATTESKRIQILQKTAAVSQADADAAKSNELVAKAGLDIAAAELAKQKAALRLAQINLDATRIKSPIDGILIDRRVNVGQTVVASLNTPSLFLIAGDLKKMEIWASVNEADIAQIQVGQPVEFTVEAFPKQTFNGKVAQVRLNAQLTQNVVTYTVVIAIDNPDEELLPYMTANVEFEVGDKHAVVLIPTAALGWRPQVDWIALDARDKPVNVQKRKRQPRVWVVEGMFVRPIDIQLGLSDGKETEITAGDVKEGQEVIIGEAHTATTFAPRRVQN